VEVRIADSFRARLVGLALRRHAPLHALLLPRTRAVHTFGMRFALDLWWLDERGEVLRVDRAVPPRRLRRCAAAAAVLEVPSPSSGAG
jgi:uncharacterized protein